MSKDPPSSYLDQYPLNLPEGMRDLLGKEAVDSKRSINAEIIHRLEQSFALDGSTPSNKVQGAAAAMHEVLQTAKRLACLIEEKKDADASDRLTSPTGLNRPIRKDTSLRADYYKLRLPNGLRARIKEESSKNKKSMNAEIVGRLEHSLAGDALRRYGRIREPAVIVEDIVEISSKLIRLIQEKYSS